MAYVNVKRDVTDQFYRYKMPLLIAKVSSSTLLRACVLSHCMCVLFCVRNSCITANERRWKAKAMELRR